jgi:hypothetical protein
MANLLQIQAIARFHRHLQRAGWTGSLDDSARIWIARYARLWRSRFEATLATAA